MRLLIVTQGRQLPLIDCELGSRMMALYGRRPRANRARCDARGIAATVAGALGLGGLGYVLTVLLLTF